MTTELIEPGSASFHSLFSTFTRSAYRLETLQSYGASGEDAAFTAFLNGDSYTRHPGKDVWLGHLARASSIGATMSRVHVLTEPLTDYARFEATWAYAPNVDAGEDIRVICLDEHDSWPHGVPQHDYWLFDEARLYDMHYASDGAFLGVEPVYNEAAVQEARQQARTAWQLAVSWSEWISDRPDLTPHLPR